MPRDMNMLRTYNLPIGVRCGMVFLLSIAFPAYAGDTLIISAVKGDPRITSIGEVLRKAYERLGITIKILALPGKRALEYVNDGKTDGEMVRIEGISASLPTGSRSIT
jgi:hypothetical protein